MTKQSLIDAIVDFLDSDQSGEQKAKAHPEIVELHLIMAFNQIVYNTWINGKKFSDFSQLDAWSRTYPCAVVPLVATKAYTLLPFAPLQLPDSMGIRQVCDHDVPSNVFAPIEATSNAIFQELEVSTMDDKPTYRLEQNDLAGGAGEESHKLVLENMPADAISFVDVLMLVSLEQLDDFDEVAIPSGMETNLIQQTIDLMSKKPTPDTANDNVIE